MANSKLHDDLVNEIEPHEDVKSSIASLVDALADRIEASAGNPVKLTDLKTVLREDPGKVAKAVLANTPAARNKTQTTSDIGAPSAAFEKPREGVRAGMSGTGNDHRDQVFPETASTESERQNIRREGIARDRGAQVVVNTTLPDVSAADKEADDKAKTDTKAIQHGQHVKKR